MTDALLMESEEEKGRRGMFCISCESCTVVVADDSPNDSSGTDERDDGLDGLLGSLAFSEAVFDGAVVGVDVEKENGSVGNSSGVNRMKCSELDFSMATFSFS